MELGNSDHWWSRQEQFQGTGETKANWSRLCIEWLKRKQRQQEYIGVTKSFAEKNKVVGLQLEGDVWPSERFFEN